MQNQLKFKNLFLRLLPFIISLFAGTVAYILADILVEDEGLNGLIVNIASGLLSIPIVFIFYEVVNDICSKDIRNSVEEHLCFEINYVIIDIIKLLRNMLSIEENLDKDSLEELLSKDKKFIKKHLIYKDAFSENLQEYKNKLSDLVHNNNNSNVLSGEQIKSILVITKDLGILAKEIQQIKNSNNNEFIENTTAELLKSLSEWIDLGEDDAIINHHSFNLI